jgi:hypothetical protein
MYTWHLPVLSTQAVPDLRAKCTSSYDANAFWAPTYFEPSDDILETTCLTTHISQAKHTQVLTRDVTMAIFWKS